MGRRFKVQKMWSTYSVYLEARNRVHLTLSIKRKHMQCKGILFCLDLR